jgi:hypothetical protein
VKVGGDCIIFMEEIMGRRVLSMAVLAMTFSLSAASIAFAQATKEEKTTGVYEGWGTIKATPVGKELLLVSFEDFGPAKGEGITDHMTWRCWGIGEFVNGKGRSHGYCLGQDPSGDQLAEDWTETEDHALDAKPLKGTIKLTSGTGKFAGITGSGTYEDYGNAWKPITEGTYMVYAPYEISYTLPAVGQ